MLPTAALIVFSLRGDSQSWDAAKDTQHDSQGEMDQWHDS